MAAGAKSLASTVPHPLHQELESMVKQDPWLGWQLLSGRRTGRTTCIALRAIAEAMENPGVGVMLVDHHHGNDADFHLSRMVLAMVQSMGMKHLHVDQVRYKQASEPSRPPHECPALAGYQLVFEVRSRSL
jgi:hypothetical protein